MDREKWRAISREPSYAYGVRVKSESDIEKAHSLLQEKVESEVPPMLEKGRLLRKEPTVMSRFDSDSEEWKVKVWWRFWPEGFTKEDVTEVERHMETGRIPLL